MKHSHYDIFIIGGGINGSALARDASGRGYRVGLSEMNDLASATSSASTKLIHGGLRYLEHYAFRLVREALCEREVILHNAPHLVEPMRFILPFDNQKRPFWFLCLGLFLYDHLGKRKEFLPTHQIQFSHMQENALKPKYIRGFEYSDARVDDSRLVIANARHAKKLGADIFTNWKVIQAECKDKLWHITLKNKKNIEKEITAKYLVNASGPYIQDVLKNALSQKNAAPIRLVKGSHIIVPAIFNHEKAYIFQNEDNRIVFAIPYQEEFTLIGTTDIDYKENPENVEIDENEISYLCESVNKYFKMEINKEMVVSSYSGVRSLYDNHVQKAQETTRDYVLQEKKSSKMLPLLNIYGGKITTYRKLSEDALQIIDKTLNKKTNNWTENVPLPGGDFGHKNIKALERKLLEIQPEFSDKTIKRLVRAYGTDVFQIFSSGKEKGLCFGHELYEIEVLWMIEEEWATTADDVLWRRSKLGLFFDEKEKTILNQFMIDYQKNK